MIPESSYICDTTDMPAKMVLRGTHQGRSFSVVTSYDTASDRWPVHAYVNGRRVKGFIAGLGDSEADAKAIGLAAVEAKISFRASAANFRITMR